MAHAVHKLKHSRSLARMLIIGCGGPGTSWLKMENAADGGQFVLGQPRNKRNKSSRCLLPTVADLFPEIAMPLLDGGDGLPSCSAVEALERQEPYINQVLAYHALALLTRLLRHGYVSYHGRFVNLATGNMAPLPVERNA